MKIIIIVADKTDLGDSGGSGERPPGGLRADLRSDVRVLKL